MFSRRIAAVAAAILLASAYSASAVEWQAGYDLNSNQAGFGHSIAGEAAFEYIETGIALGFGAKPFHEQVINQTTGSSTRIELRGLRASALRLDVPFRLTFGKWPYLFGALAYERILDVPGVEKTAAEGFAKANDLALQCGAGYNHWFRNFGIRLEMGWRALAWYSDKTRFYRDPTSGPTDQVTFETDRFGSAISWRAGLRYRFRSPGG